MIPKFTKKQFDLRYPDDKSCLEKLFQLRFSGIGKCPKCNGVFNFKPVYRRKSYQCQHTNCQHQIYPMAGTIFQKSTTSLKDWFFAMYLFTSTRNGVSAKELERTLDVSYPTALRMAHQIKILMGNKTDYVLSGIVEIDETHIGGLKKNKHVNVRKIKTGTGGDNMVTVLGMLQRNGTVNTVIIEKAAMETSQPILKESIDPSSTIITDGHGSYYGLNKSFKKHEIVNHQKDEFVRGKFHTNSIEGFWSHLKRMIKGTHIHVSRQHLQKYIDENTFRYENRNHPEKMFETLISRVAV